MTKRRRDLVVLGGIFAVIGGLRALPWDRLPGRGPRYAAIAGLPPFRRLDGGGPTLRADLAAIGLDPALRDADLRRARAETLRADACPALFGIGASVPVRLACFSDFLSILPRHGV